MSDFETICRIADRAEALYDRLNLIMPTDRMGLIMDIDYTHRQFDLDLEAWLASDDGNFSHDLGGILRHWDRDLMAMTDGFTPRYAAQLPRDLELEGESQIRGMAEA